MKLKFTKMHGLGNDYIFFDCREKMFEHPGDVARAMSPRHTSVGADGIVLICRSDTADAGMRMFNSDGSEGKMCGNAIRCVGKYLYEYGGIKKEQLDIETLSGIRHLCLEVSESKVLAVTVDMGKALLYAENVKAESNTDPASRCDFLFDNGACRICGRFLSVTVGNPHAVVFLHDLTGTEDHGFCDLHEIDLKAMALAISESGPFPDGVNVELVALDGSGGLAMRVCERGSGETMACGTGACASVAAAVKLGYLPHNSWINVRLEGGMLEIKCSDEYILTMKGPAEKVYDGEYEYVCDKPGNSCSHK